MIWHIERGARPSVTTTPGQICVYIHTNTMNDIRRVYLFVFYIMNCGKIIYNNVGRVVVHACNSNNPKIVTYLSEGGGVFSRELRTTPSIDSAAALPSLVVVTG